jgi:hypothetical protein
VVIVAYETVVKVKVWTEEVVVVVVEVVVVAVA